MKTMVYLITQRQEKNSRGDPIDMLENTYVLYFERFGITLVPIPNWSHRVEQYVTQLPVEGIIITGGNDVDPKSYGESVSESLSLVPQRDLVEKELLDLAIKYRIPVLGICRGMQFMNVYFGGKLQRKAHPPAQDHDLEIIDSKVQATLGVKTRVNSYHNHAVIPSLLSPQLQSFAQSWGGIIEGIYHPTLPIAGIQWHPERKSPNEEFNRKLVEAFVKKELFWRQKSNP